MSKCQYCHETLFEFPATAPKSEQTCVICMIRIATRGFPRKPEEAEKDNQAIAAHMQSNEKRGS